MPRVTVVVRDINTGDPVQGAWVSLCGVTGTTDARGRVTLTVPAGRCVLVVLHRWYYPVRRIIEVRTDGTIYVDLVPVGELYA